MKIKTIIKYPLFIFRFGTGRGGTAKRKNKMKTAAERHEDERAIQHITADKREIKDFPKLPSATSFIRKPLYERL